MDITGQASATGEGGLSDHAAADVFAELAAFEDFEGQAGEDEAGEAEDDDSAFQDDDEDADPDEDAGEDEEQPLYAVKIDGEDYAVTLDELRGGYQREADYRRKTQALAEERKALVPERAALAAERQALAQTLAAAEAALTGPVADTAELDRLRRSDPAEYAALVADMSRRDADRERIAAARSLMEAQDAAEAAQVHQQRVVEERARLYAARPDWADPEKGEAASAMIRAYAAEIGADPEEVDGITDHRLLIALHEAAQYRAARMRAASARRVTDPIRTARPRAASVAPGRGGEISRARQRLQQTGRTDDAAALFLTLSRE